MIENLIDRLLSLDVHLQLIDRDQLKVNAKEGSLSGELLAEIRSEKPALIAYLKEHAAADDFMRIPPAAPEPSYVLSSSQRRLWVLSQLAGGNTAYNVTGVEVVEGELDREALQYAFGQLVGRHEVLRTVFREDEVGEVRQYVLDAGGVDGVIGYRDLREEALCGEMAEALVQEAFGWSFDLSKGPLVRMQVLRVGKDRWLLVYVMHHIISDGWSMDILIRELLRLYDDHRQGLGNRLPSLRLQYKDYAVWQQGELRGEEMGLHRRYWLEQLSGELPVMELRGDAVRPAVKSYRGGAVYGRIGSEQAGRLRKVVQDRGATLYMGLVGLVTVLLYRYSGQQDMLIGIPVAGRGHIDLEEQIGCYLNTLVLRMRFEGGEDFGTMVDRVRAVTLGAYGHQAYPFDELVNELNVRRDLSRHPLFDVMVILQNTVDGGRGGWEGESGLRTRGYEGGHRVSSKFDLLFDFIESGEEIGVRLEYNSDIYRQRTVEGMLGHLVGLLGGVLGDPGSAIDAVGYMSGEEQRRLVEGLAGPVVGYGSEGTIADLIERQAAVNGDKVAVLAAGETLSYGELNGRANRLARYLRSRGVGRGKVVPLCVDRTAGMLIGLLGIVKAGGAFLPLDGTYPRERIGYMVGESGAELIVTEERYREMFDGQEVVVLDGGGDMPDGMADERPCPGAVGSDLAYVLYTSGSTGRPKGVMIGHGSLLNFLCSMREILGAGEQDSLLAVTTYSFDIAYLELFLMLTCGGRVIVVSREEATDSRQLMERLAEHRPTYMQATPSTWKMLVEGGWGNAEGTVIMTGGEALPETLKDQLVGLGGPKVINLYGPTETTIWATWSEQRKEEAVTIGGPIANTHCYVLDKNRRLVPAGVVGELYIGGVQVGRGYLKRPELTEERFMADPYREGGRIYRTGDEVRWLADGRIEYLGRVDDQVKVRGYRIEPGEVEKALMSLEGIQAAVVVATDGTAGDNYLVGYVISDSRQGSGELRRRLLGSLPAYMIPASFIQVEAFPLTSNGKIDRKALKTRLLSSVEEGKARKSPANEMEARVMRVWQQVLQRYEAISTDADFFSVGGHSLRVMQLVNQYYRLFEIKVGLQEVFDNPTIEAQASLLSSLTQTRYTPIEMMAEADDYMVSDAQHRLWVQTQTPEGSKAYNLYTIIPMEGDISAPLLERAMNEVIERYEILRTVFRVNENGELRQAVIPADQSRFRIQYADLEGRSKEEADAYLLRERRHLFDPYNGPLLRGGLIRLGDDRSLFHFNIHQLIADGLTVDILTIEVSKRYESYRTGTTAGAWRKTVQYKDYVAWQHRNLSDGMLRKQRAYWLNEFSDGVPVLDLPTDNRWPPIKTYNGKRLSVVLDNVLFGQMQELCEKHQSTLFMGALSVFYLLFYRYTGQQDIVMGYPVAGRNDTDLEYAVGFFINTLALRMRLNADGSFLQLLASVKKAVLAGVDNQFYPFKLVVDDLAVMNDPSHSPLFDVLVVAQHLLAEASPYDLSVGDNEGIIDEGEYPSAFPIVIWFGMVREGFRIHIRYNTDLFRKETIIRLITHYIELLKGVTADPGLPLWKYRYMREGDRTLLLGRYGVRSNAYPAGETITGVFRARAGEAPGAIAVRYKEVSLTYGELDRRSSEVALLLRQRGVGRDMPVGLLMERSADLIVAILGILKAGGAYLPIDTELPKERQHYIIRDGRVRLLLSGRGLGEEVPDGVEVVYLEDAVADNGEVVLEDIHGPDDLCYVIYTSGTTGNPKGVMIMHRNITGLLLNEGFPFDFGRDDVWTMFHSHCFDFSVWEIFGALLRGGKLIIVPREVTRDSYRYLELLEEEGVTVLNQTPGAFYQLIQAAVTRPGGLAALRYVVLGGEALSPVRLKEWKAAYPGVRLYNGYGITETTIFVSFHEVSQADIDNNSNNIGRPLPSASVYLLDGHGEPVAEGITGEIYVGGLGVARGYLHNEGLTEQRFVPDVLGGGGRLYRSGDLARIGDHGEIEYVGRADHQIKIRGYRVDPLEIEHTLQGLPGIGSAVVLAVEDERGERRLAAYITGEASQDSQALRLRLADILPGYMIPAYLIPLQDLPLTADGQIDEQALLSCAREAATEGRNAAPRNDVEERLATMWKEVLGLSDKPGIYDNFFEIGGQSIRGIQLLFRISREFGIEMSRLDIFEQPTIEQQANAILSNRTQPDAASYAPGQEYEEMKL